MTNINSNAPFRIRLINHSTNEVLRTFYQSRLFVATAIIQEYLDDMEFTCSELNCYEPIRFELDFNDDNKSIHNIFTEVVHYGASKEEIDNGADEDEDEGYLLDEYFENEDLIEMGFNPYEGCYDFDC